VLNVSEHRKRRSVEELGVEAPVDDRHDGAHRVGAVADAVEDRLLAHAPVQQIGLDQALRVLDLAAVARVVHRIAALGQPLQRADVGGHVALGRRHHAGVPAHDMVAGEQDPRALERKAQVIGSMPRRVQGRHRPAVALESLPVLQGNVGDEVLLDELPARRAGALGAAVGGLASEAHGLGPGGGEQGRQAVGVVAVGVGDQHMADAARGHGRENGGKMFRVLGPRIDEGQVAGAHEVGVGALECEVVGVVGDDAHHAGGKLARLAVGEVHRRPERQRFRHGRPFLELVAGHRVGAASARSRMQGLPC